MSAVAVSANSDSSDKSSNTSSEAKGEDAESSAKMPPGSLPPDGAIRQDEAAVQYAESGDWKKALQLIKAMRDNKLTPSVTAYVATIEACRREHLFEYASALLKDMNRVCLPEDLFKEYAASHPNSPGVTQTQRVFALLLMMREDDVTPLEETYRAIMGLCTKEGLWHLSLLLLEHMRREGLVPRKFVWDEICSVLFKTGHAEMATMLFETALENIDEEEEGRVDPSGDKLDLHHFTASTALAAVRVVLLDMIRKPTTRVFHDPNRPLDIITGMGNNSKDGEAVIKPQVMELLTAMGLEPKMKRHNEGCIVLRKEALLAYVARTSPPPRGNTEGSTQAADQ